MCYISNTETPFIFQTDDNEQENANIEYIIYSIQLCCIVWPDSCGDNKKLVFYSN